MAGPFPPFSTCLKTSLLGALCTFATSLLQAEVPIPPAKNNRTETPADALWAYHPPRVRQVPDTDDTTWPRNPIDRFILSKLESRQLRPVQDADKTTLIRRLTYDLIGLSPKPTEIDAFLADDSDDALPALVDRLLASPHFGERWARHWLDVVRFAESVTLRGLVFEQAWRYRDYVVEAFNQDRPFDEFVREQISGDLMHSQSLEERQRRMIATGFLTFGNTNLEDQDKAQLRMDVVDEQLDTIGKTFMAQTFGCARCHDHKFDPVPTREYYAMAGIFRNTVTLIDANVSNWIEVALPLEPEKEEEFRERESTLARLQAELQTVKKRAKELSSRGETSSGTASTQGPAGTDERQAPSLPSDNEPSKVEQLKTARAEQAHLEAQIKHLNSSDPIRPMVMSVREEKEIRDTSIHLRGNVHHLGDDVPRGFLKVATHRAPPEIKASESGRREFADWTASASNPLTARVFANRVWHWLFGAGIVRTTDNFGRMGERPSHPELLDYLALTFMDHDWSVKALIRQVVLSRTYQLASNSDGIGPQPGTSPSSTSNDIFEAGTASDPENRTFWRMNRRRLEAECLRDSMLSSSDTLDLTMGGNTIRSGTKADYGYLDIDTRRSLYVPVFRNALPDLFEAFDFANPSMVTGRRNTSTVAPQALFFLNHPFVMEHAAKTAARLLAATSTPNECIQSAYRTILGRIPTAAELQVATAFVSPGDDLTPDPTLELWTEFVQALFASIDFRYLD